MTRKPAALSADLVAVKGAAMPAPDMSGRADSRGSTCRREAGRRESLAPLNFRVPASFRREFKTYAARHDLKLNELLRLSFRPTAARTGIRRDNNRTPIGLVAVGLNPGTSGEADSLQALAATFRGSSRRP